MASLLVFETHPVQYRAPIYAQLNNLCPGSVHVAYASDFSITGSFDPEFSCEIAWDTDLLSGYDHTFMSRNKLCPPMGFRGLSGSGVFELIRNIQPDVILITSLRYEFDFAAYCSAIALRIPIWLRLETQDQAFKRSRLKSAIRSTFYKLIYSQVQRAFPIGILNHAHFLTHGLDLSQLSNAYYSTPNNVEHIGLTECLSRRNSLRSALEIPQEHVLISFFGKLIPKKNPEILLEALQYLGRDIKRISILYVGNGSLAERLSGVAAALHKRYAVNVHFAGFVNQSSLPDYYLASDIVVLPSNFSGETWGLVVNEALQAGCSVIVSNAVGCLADFSALPRLKSFPVGSSTALAQSILELIDKPRDFYWAKPYLTDYTQQANARVLADELHRLDAARNVFD
jgi:glycosyltransferase involved in cell wall biosynthesis